MTEGEIQRRIQVLASRHGFKLWRNNTGLGWIGKSTRLPSGDVLISQARPLHAGLCVGSPDLIGLREVTITQEMVGSKVAIFSGIEIKSERGRISTEQESFISMTQSAGGISFVARSEEEFLERARIK